MAHLHNEGELLVLDDAFDGRTVEVGLYNDTTDGLTEDSTYSDITTEPTGNGYAPGVVENPPVSQNDENDAEVVMDDITFDVSDSTESVDYVYVRDDVSGDLILTNTLDQEYDLDSIDNFDLSNVGMSLS